jgi:hypothetical protein
MTTASTRETGDLMSDADVHGPIDTVIIQFPSSASGSATTEALVDLIERGTVQVYDVLVVEKRADGSCHELDLAAADGPLADFRALSGARSGLLGDEDVAAVGEVLDPGSAAVAIVYENAWAVPFVGAALGEGGELVAGTRLTAQQIMDTLDELEAN